jgi:hypothetical protein
MPPRRDDHRVLPAWSLFRTLWLLISEDGQQAHRIHPISVAANSTPVLPTVLLAASIEHTLER